MNNQFYAHRFNSPRIALWHEAAHAVAAHVLGRRVYSLGLDPLPHCLVNQIGLSKEDQGLLLCAGAAACIHAFGQPWGQHNDYAIAEKLGDLEEFKAKALEFVREYESEILFVVDQLAKDTYADRKYLTRVYGKLYFGNDHNYNSGERDVVRLSDCHPAVEPLTKLVSRATPGKKLKWFLRKYASFQLANPAVISKFAKASARLGLNR